MEENWVRVPTSTYRVQFNKGFTFEQAEAIQDYLQELGISDLYVSPIFLATPESTHGYDVCGFELNPNLGSREQFERMADGLKERGLGLLADIVPNHMGNHLSNSTWRDVLKNGPNSANASFFDIDWNPASNPSLRGKVLLPILGDHYGEVLSRGELKLVWEAGELQLVYYDRHFPVSPESEEWLRARGGSIEERIAECNGDKRKLHEFIQQQHYRLAFWRVGPYEINYRRFFDVTDLIAVRVEDEAVFQKSHALILELIRSGRVTGLRVDHPDGLRDPKTYFDRLLANGAGYVVAEKILSEGEGLPEDWAVQGTTGYDFLNMNNGLFVHPAGERTLTELYEEFAGSSTSYEDVAYSSKRHVLDYLFVAEVEALAGRLKEIAAQTMRGIDFTQQELRDAIVEFIAEFPVYRTYVRADRKYVDAEETEYIERSVRAAGELRLNLKGALRFLARVLRMEIDTPAALEFVLRFQQLTGPATAKGLEDTAFYRYARFVSLNEVGGHPGEFGVSLKEFHAYNEQKAARWPHSMLASATHDTKRGEEVRARLNVLSELGEEWAEVAHAWRKLNEKHKQHASAPSLNDEYLLYQTIVGSWSPEAETDRERYIARIQEYMLKAGREAKSATAWTDPDTEYENATKEFAADILKCPDFAAAFQPLYRRITYFAVFNSLSQLVLKTFSPGVPDFYQGNEIWDLDLVDPDNRRPVDYGLRRELLKKVQKSAPARLLEQSEDGAVKMFVTWKSLTFRREKAKLFRDGPYRPLWATGPFAEHVCAFERGQGSESVIVVVPRFLATLLGGKEGLPLGNTVWQNTAVPLEGKYRNVFTGEEVETGGVGELLKSFPVAVLEKAGA